MQYYTIICQPDAVPDTTSALHRSVWILELGHPVRAHHPWCGGDALTLSDRLWMYKVWVVLCLCCCCYSDWYWPSLSL